MLILCVLSFPAIAASPADPGEHVLSYLDHTVEWYHRVTGLDQTSVTSEELLFRDAVRQNADQILHLAFAYAHGEAAWLANQSSATTAPTTGGTNSLALAVEKANQRVITIQTQLDQTSRQTQDATQPASETLTARHDMLVAELNLAKARQDVLQDLLGFNNANGTNGGLAQKVDDLEKSLPEAQANSQVGAPPKTDQAVPTADQAFRPEAAGILGLITELFTLTGQMKELDGLVQETATLHKRVEDLQTPIRKELLDAIHRADSLSQSGDTDDAKALAGEGKQFDALSARFKLITAAKVPLRKQLVFLDSTRSNLKEWHTAVGRTYARVVRALLVRIGAIVISILVLLGISSLWRRATFRYVNDVKRRRQFLMIRRFVVGAIIVVIVVGGVVTEFSSLMTFAGLITAGIAVALQTVILSGVAHFFFMGRYGVRVGDRVTISGITGDVIDIGIFRLYLMELSGEGKDLNPTGRIVVFSNSVLFQPSAFFKQLPGADYAWHEVALTLAANADHNLAETKLLGAVESVFNQYRDAIQKQYMAVKDTVHFNVPPPEPKGRMRFIDQGLEYVVRYPVEIWRGPEIDDQVTRSLLDTIQKEPSLKLVVSGTPKIQPATN